ncbi:hypothetical protein ISF6_0559 [Piscinibacter sakaiensis]|uniref:Uncharacterized protein n=1 Tax=Piscinibacter sakaiensis TaxID=1547922 RepID=A0A0K8P8R1_PISS1|nr:hypothetical protein ISF6_0559 [Piscinibacter sakaiensis]
MNSREVRTNGLELPILSDPGNEVAAAFGLRFTLPAYRIKQYRKLKNDLPTPRARVVGARGDELFGGPGHGMDLGQCVVGRFARDEIGLEGVQLVLQ